MTEKQRVFQTSL